MSETTIKITDPMATIADAAARIYESTLNYAATVRATESEASRDEEDHIRFQAYWDVRAVFQFLGLVKEPLSWPPPATGASK